MRRRAGAIPEGSVGGGGRNVPGAQGLCDALCILGGLGRTNHGVLPAAPDCVVHPGSLNRSGGS